MTFKDETNFQIDQLRQGEPHSIQRKLCSTGQLTMAYTDIEELGIFDGELPSGRGDLTWHKVKNVNEKLSVQSDKSKFAYTMEIIEDKNGRPVSYAISMCSPTAYDVV